MALQADGKRWERWGICDFKKNRTDRSEQTDQTDERNRFPLGDGGNDGQGRRKEKGDRPVARTKKSRICCVVGSVFQYCFSALDWRKKPR
jgi:hypothetical protein